MQLLNTHIHELRFSIDMNAPLEVKKKWTDFKHACESYNYKEQQQFKIYIVEQVKFHCKLNTNKELPFLKRCEGGFGGNNNSENKQIRFRSYFENGDYKKRDNDIILDHISNTDKEKWSYDELDDLIRAFIKTITYHIQHRWLEENDINGRIQMFNKEMLDNDYYHSDSES